MSGKTIQKIDTNINNYTLVDLLTILEIDVPTVENVTDATERYIRKYESENNQTMAFFFKDMRDTLLVYVSQLKTPKDAEYGEARAEYELWWSSQQVLPQNDQVQKDKITDRRNTTTTFNNQYFPMNEKQLGVTNVKNVEVAQDTLNPTLTNTTTRIISLDSQYRQVSGINNLSTDYTLDLTEPLINVLSLRPYSFQVPYTWYTINVQNSCFFISFVDEEGEITTSVTISLQYGNYSTTSFTAELTSAFEKAGFTFTSAPATFNSINGKLTLNLFGGTYTDGETIYEIDGTTTVTFFDPSNQLSCYNGPCLPTTVINHTLGWLMGFRLPFITVYSDGNEAAAILSLTGPRYLIVVLDDYNQNHLNAGLIGIDQLSKTLKLPSYYSRDLPVSCTPPDPTGTNIKTNTTQLANNVDAGTLIMDKWNATYVPTVKVLPSAPRILTKSQIYSINEILKNNSRYSNTVKTSCPTNSDTFAIIPLDKKNMTTGEIYVEDSSTLQLNKRVYFGPVHIERLHLKLLDDQGNLLDLNGGEWCMTVIAEVLYQY